MRYALLWNKSVELVAGRLLAEETVGKVVTQDIDLYSQVRFMYDFLDFQLENCGIPGKTECEQPTPELRYCSARLSK